MRTRDSELEGRGLVPPYGPTRGMLESLQLLRRSTPPRIDSDFLRVSRIAPGNEYKVVGALRYLGLIDDEGRPTESSRVLKTKGATHTLHLQEIVQNAYPGIFQGQRLKEITREGIYNYFVTEGGLGAEMANKATRFLTKLCRLAEMEIAPDAPQPSTRGRRKGRSQRARYPLGDTPPDNGQAGIGAVPFVVALTPETAQMSVEELTDLFRKLRQALEQSRAG